MIEIIDKKHCTGCEACLNACAHGAITMTADEEGFLYPQINQTLCVDCGLCSKVCPVIHYDERQEARLAYSMGQKAFAAKTKNETDRAISSSGGIFPALARAVLEKGGIVAGAAFDDNFNVYHKLICNKDNLIEIQSSKYAQSSIGLIYKDIRKQLTQGKLVLFAGMACQVEGLKSYLRKDYENLYTADLICMGIPSPGVWRKYLDSTFKGEKIKRINFKDKTYGWRTFSMRIETDKRVLLEKGFDNRFFECMFKTYTLRPSCFNCPFKKSRRFSDFTLADCWGTVKEVPQLDDNKGLSSVVVHSRKGLDLWHRIETMDFAEVTVDSIARHNDNLVRNKLQKDGREEFFRILNVSPLKAFKKFGRNPQKGMLIKIKSIVRKITKLVCR